MAEVSIAVEVITVVKNPSAKAFAQAITTIANPTL